MKDPTPVAVTSRSFSRHAVLRAELLERYETVTFNNADHVLSGDELVNFLRGHVKAIMALETLDESVLSKLPELRVVSKFGVGLDTFDFEAMERYGVMLSWKGGTNKRSVSELVIVLAISLLRHVVTANRELQSGIWRQPKGSCLSGCTVGVIGCGHIGRDLITLLKPFGCNILCYDVEAFPDFYAEYNVRPVGLEDLLREADVVTLHVPLNESTQNLLNAERLALMKPSAILINTARGHLVDEQALKEMLKSNSLAGAAFDVFAEEPHMDTELLNLPNFLATPHIGGSTEEAILAMGRAAIAGLDAARQPSLISGMADSWKG
jgi:D-3-phosphoglycerate dehydrogenase